jgi:hypothetical protein
MGRPQNQQWSNWKLVAMACLVARAVVMAMACWVAMETVAASQAWADRPFLPLSAHTCWANRVICLSGSWLVALGNRIVTNLNIPDPSIDNIHGPSIDNIHGPSIDNIHGPSIRQIRISPLHRMSRFTTILPYFRIISIFNIR